MRGQLKPFTKEELRIIRDLYEEEGSSLRKTAQALSTSKARVRRALVEMGIEIRGYGGEPEHIPTLEEIWGVRTKEIQASWTDKQRQKRLVSIGAVPWEVPMSEVLAHRKKLPSSTD